MKGKPTASGQQVVINNVFKYFKANNPSDRDYSLFMRTAEATGLSLSTVRRIVKQKDGPKTPGKKRTNRKEEFSKLDEFDLGVIRRIVHGYYARNETFSLKKITKTIEGGNRFSIFHLHIRFCTEKAWLSFQETTA